MLIQQIIEFELRDHGTPGRTCTPKLGNIMTKQKSPKEDLCVDYYLLLKYCRSQSLPQKCQILNVCWV